MTVRTHRHRAALTLASAALAATSLAACGEDDTEDAATPDPGTSSESTGGGSDEPEEMTFEEVSDDLGSMVGEDVRVRAQVEDVVMPGVFTINDASGNTLESIVVVDAEDVAELATDEEVVVDATVEAALDPDDVAELLDVQLDDEMLTDYDGQPYLEADGVTKADG